MNRIEITAVSKKYEKEGARAKLVCQKALRSLKKDGVLVELFFISEKKMQELNKLWRGKDVSTNVLSFVENEAGMFVSGREVSHKKLGEIYLSLDFIKKHDQSLAHMLVHGLLHLLGYDHMNKKDSEKMEKKEVIILNNITK